MNRMMVRAALLVALVSVLILAGCARDDDAAAAPEADDEPMIAAMATDVGGLGDRSFNDGAFAGLELGAAYGFEARVVESRQQTDYIPNLTGLAEDGAEIVFAVGFLMEEAVKEAAAMHPDTYFGGIDIGGSDDLDNFQGVLFREQESGFLAGVVAGLMTSQYAGVSDRLNDAPVVGTVLGMDIPPVERFEVGYIQGVNYVAPDVEVLSATVGDFVDQARGQEAALAMIEQGADVVFHIAGQTGLGVIEAAREQGVYAIGVDVDQNEVAPDTVLTSAVKNIPNSIDVILQGLAEGSFEGGSRVYGLEDGATGIAPFHGHDAMIPQEVKDAVEEATAAILSGELTVASNRAELAELLQ